MLNPQGDVGELWEGLLHKQIGVRFATEKGVIYRRVCDDDCHCA